MLKVNPSEGTVATSGQTQDTQAPKSQRYLLSQPIQDKTSFSGTEEQPPKKSNTMAWVVGLGATIAAVAIAVKTHKKVDTKAVEKAAGEAKPKATRSYSSGGGGSRRVYTERINREYNTEKLTALKNQIQNHIGKDITLDFERPSEIINQHFTSFDKEYSSESLKDMYKLTKRQIPNITDEAEKLRSENASAVILNKLKTAYTKEGNKDGAALVDKIMDKELNGLIEKHLGKDGSKLAADSKSFNEYKQFVQEFKNMDLNPIFRAFDHGKQTVHASELLPSTLSSFSERLMENVVKKNPKTISKEGRVLIDSAEKFNNKSIELLDKMGFSESEISKEVKGTAERIKELKLTLKPVVEKAPVEELKPLIEKSPVEELKLVEEEVSGIKPEKTKKSRAQKKQPQTAATGIKLPSIDELVNGNKSDYIDYNKLNKDVMERIEKKKYEFHPNYQTALAEHVEETATQSVEKTPSAYAETKKVFNETKTSRIEKTPISDIPESHIRYFVPEKNPSPTKGYIVTDKDFNKPEVTAEVKELKNNSKHPIIDTHFGIPKKTAKKVVKPTAAKLSDISAKTPSKKAVESFADKMTTRITEKLPNGKEYKVDVDSKGNVISIVNHEGFYTEDPKKMAIYFDKYDINPKQFLKGEKAAIKETVVEKAATKIITTTEQHKFPSGERFAVVKNAEDEIIAVLDNNGHKTSVAKDFLGVEDIFVNHDMEPTSISKGIHNPNPVTVKVTPKVVAAEETAVSEVASEITPAIEKEITKEESVLNEKVIAEDENLTNKPKRNIFKRISSGIADSMKKLLPFRKAHVAQEVTSEVAPTVEKAIVEEKSIINADVAEKVETSVGEKETTKKRNIFTKVSSSIAEKFPNTVNFFKSINPFKKH